MLGKLRIAPRLAVLIGVQLILLIVIGLFALTGLKSGSQSTEVVFNNGLGLVKLNLMEENVTVLQETANRVNTGAMIWGEGRTQLVATRTKFDVEWTELRSVASVDTRTLVENIAAVNAAFDELSRLFESENTSHLSLFVLNDLAELIDPFKSTLAADIQHSRQQSEETYQAALQSVNNFFYFNIAIIIGGIILMGGLGFRIYRSIVDPMEKISKTVSAVTEGDFNTRSELKGLDEIAELGTALDQMLEDKVSSLVEAEEENEALNDSVVRLLEAVAALSERDLTIQVPVSKDVTGPVADAINLMVEETADVLTLVNRIANHLGHSCSLVHKQSVTVNDSAVAQKIVVEEVAKNLSDASRNLGVIAETARECDLIASETSTSTEKTASTVAGTLQSMNDIRESIQETGKRIKRLGDRSQEISSVVDIINTFAERTHVLALNASMQAAAAGDAGRGFAVVAEEVQRLAQSSRDATAQIADLVKNIQVDTNDTITTMDKTITTVVAGSSMAESAGRQMEDNRVNTQKLVAAVNKIAQDSQSQAKESLSMMEQADNMKISSIKTSEGMEEQMGQTQKMVGLAKHLLKSVRVFKLPVAESNS